MKQLTVQISDELYDKIKTLYTNENDFVNQCINEYMLCHYSTDWLMWRKMMESKLTEIQDQLDNHLVGHHDTSGSTKFESQPSKRNSGDYHPLDRSRYTDLDKQQISFKRKQKPLNIEETDVTIPL